MGKRELEIVLISAESLTRQYPGCRMAVSAGAYITNDNSVPVQHTSADPVGDVNPRWNETLRFTLRYSSGKSAEWLYIKLYSTMPDGMFFCFGTVRIPVNDFIAFSSEQATPALTVPYQIDEKSGANSTTLVPPRHLNILEKSDLWLL
ncbi:SRC2-like protein [Rhynchospora pubera]|uniref:SRC2-like protein n=1 Tax=Rhynchospora pubera TaxID=906938 RepID=A0AAV8EUM8_9POAL|nr:SRC2-like protein [Rhynchospora pubera]